MRKWELPCPGQLGVALSPEVQGGSHVPRGWIMVIRHWGQNLRPSSVNLKGMVFLENAASRSPRMSSPGLRLLPGPCAHLAVGPRVRADALPSLFGLETSQPRCLH